MQLHIYIICQRLKTFNYFKLVHSRLLLPTCKALCGVIPHKDRGVEVGFHHDLLGSTRAQIVDHQSRLQCGHLKPPNSSNCRVLPSKSKRHHEIEITWNHIIKNSWNTPKKFWNILPSAKSKKLPACSSGCPFDPESLGSNSSTKKLINLVIIFCTPSRELQVANAIANIGIPSQGVCPPKCFFQHVRASQKSKRHSPEAPTNQKSSHPHCHILSKTAE